MILESSAGLFFGLTLEASQGEKNDEENLCLSVEAIGAKRQ
jgi:hypothetical protein